MWHGFQDTESLWLALVYIIPYCFLGEVKKSNTSLEPCSTPDFLPLHWWGYVYSSNIRRPGGYYITQNAYPIELDLVNVSIPGKIPALLPESHGGQKFSGTTFVIFAVVISNARNCRVYSFFLCKIPLTTGIAVIIFVVPVYQWLPVGSCINWKRILCCQLRIRTGSERQRRLHPHIGVMDAQVVGLQERRNREVEAVSLTSTISSAWQYFLTFDLMITTAFGCNIMLFIA